MKRLKDVFAMAKAHLGVDDAIAAVGYINQAESLAWEFVSVRPGGLPCCWGGINWRRASTQIQTYHSSQAYPIADLSLFAAYLLLTGAILGRVSSGLSLAVVSIGQ